SSPTRRIGRRPTPPGASSTPIRRRMAPSCLTSTGLTTRRALSALSPPARFLPSRTGSRYGWRQGRSAPAITDAPAQRSYQFGRADSAFCREVKLDLAEGLPGRGVHQIHREPCRRAAIALRLKVDKPFCARLAG